MVKNNNVLQEGSNPCSSCGVCSLICPVNCITIRHDENGFYRPFIDEKKCTNCSLCQQVCSQYIKKPIDFQNFFSEKEILGVWSKSTQTMQSCSSGGVAHEIFTWAIKNGYEICGVIYDEYSDIFKHVIINNIEDLEQIKKSKYMQSYTPEAFMNFDKQKKYVVIGTPYQIHGLRKWMQIKKREEQFILIDFFCHGTPSFLLWKKFTDFTLRKLRIKKIKNIDFRFKKEGIYTPSNVIRITNEKNKHFICDGRTIDDAFYKFFFSRSC